MSRFPLIRLHLSGIFMKIISVRQRLYPALLLPLTFSPVLQAASAPNEQTMIVTATPQTVSELDTPAAVSVIEGEDMRLATPRVNLSESLTSVRDCRCRTGRTTRRICRSLSVDLARVPPLACAAFVCMLMAFPPPCRMDKARFRILILTAYKTLKCYAAPSQRYTAMLPAA